ncbi:MAG: hypothetical protein M1823_002461 [Watsoniomyces obsoletus]|nr:MAG: hypothetical protein M1823_002461 [Watsoniomyces obsoletus]
MLSSLFLAGTLLCLSIPLALFALFTSTIAISALLVRVMLVYIELGGALVHSYLFTKKPIKRRSSRRKNLSNADTEAQRRRRQRSVSHGSSQGLSTPSLELRESEGGLAVAAGQVGPPGSVRDFEGVGGWRFSGPEEEDTQWTLLNSRLELPAAPERKRRHRRSLTSGSAPFPPAESSRRASYRQGSDTSSLSFSMLRGPITPPAPDSMELLSRSVPDLATQRSDAASIKERRPTAHPQQGDSASPTSSTSSRPSSRGSQLLMKHSIRD